MIRNVGRQFRSRANGLAGVLLLAACGTPKPATGVSGEAPPPEVPPPTRIDAVYPLESGGVPPEDTVARFVASRPRVIIIRRGAPDNNQFARIELGAGPGGSATESTTVTVRHRPGIYGLDLALEGPTPSQLRITFSYAMHFVAPDGARQRYGGDLGYEHALYVARVEPDGSVIYLPTTRPGSDLLSAPISGSGRYLVLAPR